MRRLAPGDVEAELSYAYLHAVAAKSAIGCTVVSRHEDNAGIDARLTAWGLSPDGGYRTEVDLNVQLRATISKPAEDDTHYSYFLRGVQRYNDLRTPTVSTPRLLVVLFLPEDADEWIGVGEGELILRRCAYWVSLRGAAATTNSSGETVKIPKVQTFTPENICH